MEILTNQKEFQEYDGYELNIGQKEISQERRKYLEEQHKKYSKVLNFLDKNNEGDTNE